VVLIATLGLIFQALIPRPGAESGVLGTDAGGGITVNNAAVDANAARLVDEFDIRTPSTTLNASTLSGGNQQKMVVAREFSRKPRLLIASQPTRGIDVGSIEFIHQRIIRQRDEGAAVLLVSAELDEIMTLSDRIAVMYKGRIIDVVPGGAATREQLGLLMAGIRRDWQTPWRTVTEVTEPREPSEQSEPGH
jgi:simple sugar transport system ATP-binding protein